MPLLARSLGRAVLEPALSVWGRWGRVVRVAARGHFLGPVPSREATGDKASDHRESHETKPTGSHPVGVDALPEAAGLRQPADGLDCDSMSGSRKHHALR